MADFHTPYNTGSDISDHAIMVGGAIINQLQEIRTGADRAIVSVTLNNIKGFKENIDNIHLALSGLLDELSRLLEE